MLFDQMVDIWQILNKRINFSKYQGFGYFIIGFIDHKLHGSHFFQLFAIKNILEYPHFLIRQAF